MGSSQTKDKNTSEKLVEVLKNKVRFLQCEIDEIMCVRETESQLYERELMVFAFKQDEWKNERDRLREEMKKMSKILEEKQAVKLREFGKCGDHEWDSLINKCRCRILEEHEKRRDETVEKWKQLYFAIKVELDHLIQRTHQEERVCLKTEEEEEMKKELKDKEERIEILEAKLAKMEQQESKREREMDILRQSLRIMSHKKRAPKLGHRSIQ